MTRGNSPDTFASQTTTTKQHIMKAIVYRKYGSPEVLHHEEVSKPTPKDNEILIKVKATAVNSGDVRIRKADPFAVRFIFGLTKPKKPILGVVLSGEVEQTGKDVKQFKVGDQVFGMTGMGFGAYAEYKCLPESASISYKPKNITHDEAAVIPFGGNTALHFLNKAGVKKGQKVLINGASGAVGTAAIQLAKFYGATVTAVCSTANLKLVKSLGADKVIDYTQGHFSDKGESYDVIFDTVGKISFARALRSLNKGGVLILGSSGLSGMMLSLWTSLTGGKKVISGVVKETAQNMAFLRDLAESGNLKPVTDRIYSLDQTKEAHAYVERGHKKGNVAIAVA
jgi:NADPH:quinone reductase-like Zn-dependent oxidoreductase